MNWDVIQGKWKQVKGSVKEKWGDLTDDELDQIDGNKDKLSGKLQEKYGWAKDDADRQIDDHFRDRTY
ncbi:CsbD family protein [Paracoccus subflavus]|uniref:CsbD family protein n=1 Tax=Paracoccus subflavus TaxID=2528244 RepID=A0A4Q9G2S1_9RHOB|nr:CsbD family protein [Paracoccus subflavus]TBN41131.1 CsbD family protein [Paracoccus subflavus]